MSFRDKLHALIGTDGGSTQPSVSDVGFTGGYDGADVFYERTAVLVDCSGSMSADMAGSGGAGTRLRAAKAAARAFVERKARMFEEDGDFAGEISIVAFNGEVVGHVPLTPYDRCERSLLPFLERLDSEDGTDFEKPLLFAERILSPKRNDAPEILDRLILLTDGRARDPKEIADRLKKNGVIIDTIGIGNSDSGESAEVDGKLLREIASILDGESRYRFIRESDDLINHFFSLAGTLSG